MRATDHIVVNGAKGNRFECLHCGRHYTPALPASVAMVIAMGKVFSAEHRACIVPQGGPLCTKCLGLAHRTEGCPLPPAYMAPEQTSDTLSDRDAAQRVVEVAAAIIGACGRPINAMTRSPTVSEMRELDAAIGRYHAAQKRDVHPEDKPCAALPNAASARTPAHAGKDTGQ